MRNFLPGPWRWTSVLLVLSISLFACRKENHAPPPPSGETLETREQELRVGEPWLSRFGAWQPCAPVLDPRATVTDVRCRITNTPRRFVSIEIGSCESMMKRHEDTVELLAYAPVCTDAAIAKLDALVAEKPVAPLYSDLSAAHLTRAHRQNNPSDYVPALAAAEEALKRDPRLPQARFNAALAQEGIGFVEEAIVSWQRLANDLPGGWKNEAAAHARQLIAQKGRDDAQQWRLNVGRLEAAMSDSNPATFESLIFPFRASAQAYVEEEVLRDWSLAASAGKTREAADKLAVASAIAGVIAKLHHDRYLKDVVRRVQTCRDPKAFADLRDGHAEFAKARAIQRSIANALPEYESAQKILERARSPLHLGAMLGRATFMTVPDPAGALHLLGDIEREAKSHSYNDILARALSARGFLFFVQGNHFAAMAEYTKAQAIYDATKDLENLGSVQSRRLGAFVEIGSIDETWRQVLLTRRYPLDFNARHLLLGETARLAVDMNHPEIAIRFQNAAVRFLQDEISQTTNARFVLSLRGHLGIAFRARASIRARLDDREGALSDLAEAARLIGPKEDARSASIPIGFRARLAEAEALAVAKTDRTAAIRFLSRAIIDIQETHYQSLRASLLLQRAELHRLDNNQTAAKSDLDEARATLRKEARDLFDEKRTPRRPDQLWDAYLSRRQVAYRQLARLLVDEHNDDEAFNQTEESRAYEPLRELQQRNVLPAAFTQISKDNAPLTLGAIEQALPEHTYLLQYCVLDDRTYVWVVRRGHSERLTLKVGNDVIAKWSASLQRYAMTRADAEFRSALMEPYSALLKKPLEQIGDPFDENNPPRVVIVADRAMQSLPFAALSDGTHYVIDQHVVSVAASATLYIVSLLQNEQFAKHPPESVLLLGDPAFDTGQDLARGLVPSVPGLRIDRIERIYKPLIPVKALTREQATIPQFLALVPRSSVLHIAAHGVTNPDAPSHSFFLLAPAENEAGTLDAERLLRDLRLENTRLAVLAACSSAGGTAVGPDGLAPLVRPLVFTGVPGVVGALWNISAQQETEELLIHFHRHYSEGLAADEALRLAQIAMRDDPAAARNTPRAWGAFQMIGSASSPFPFQKKRAGDKKP